MDARLILLGPPASGKGTQGRRLAELTGARYFSTGRQLRREMERGSDLGARAKVFLDEGNYVPDAMAMELIADWLQAAEGPWVLDGFPRTVPQAMALDECLGEEARTLKAISLTGSVENLSTRVLQRIECPDCSWVGRRSLPTLADERCPVCAAVPVPRQDDEEKNFRARWNAFEELTRPALGYYVDSQRLHEVSGEDSPEEVFAALRTSLGI